MGDLDLSEDDEEEGGAAAAAEEEEEEEAEGQQEQEKGPMTRLQTVLARIGDQADAGAPPLRRVALSFEGIGDDECEELGEGLAKSAVTQIFLVKNAITDIGLLHLSEALAANRSLTELFLNDNNIGDEGVQILCQNLAGSSLRVLNLLREPSDDGGACYLAQMILSKGCEPPPLRGRGHGAQNELSGGDIEEELKQADAVAKADAQARAAAGAASRGGARRPLRRTRRARKAFPTRSGDWRRAVGPGGNDASSKKKNATARRGRTGTRR